MVQRQTWTRRAFRAVSWLPGSSRSGGRRRFFAPFTATRLGIPASAMPVLRRIRKFCTPPVFKASLALGLFRSLIASGNRLSGDLLDIATFAWLIQPNSKRNEADNIADEFMLSKDALAARECSTSIVLW